MEDVEEARTGGQLEVLSHLLHAPDGQEDADGGAQGEEAGGGKLQLWVADKGLARACQATDVVHRDAGVHPPVWAKYEHFHTVCTGLRI